MCLTTPRPTCTQCLHHHRQCSWPEQLKRGPEKGYIEALELRFRETETLLLRVLCQISDEQLFTAIAHDTSVEEDPKSSERSFTRPAKPGSEYWRNFPLDTVLHIREWQLDSLNQDNYRSTYKEAAIDSKMATTSPTAPPAFRSAKCRRGADTSQEDLELDNSIYLSARASLPDPAGLTFPVEMRRGGPQLFTNVESPTLQPTNIDGPKLQDHGGPKPRKHEERSSWSGAPSLTFQEQFLW
ncbi:hypothetical protein BDV59DRAFT_181391 [Aspergillus ambiguus]|uniref:uncharacterized protein n=1 Tax=Aspergillus ambiguus TaxID=176160 RepID=UPI003CCE017A